MAQMTVEELIKEFSDKNNGFQFGIDIVMKSLRPNALYELSVSHGEFTVTRWDESNTEPAPSSQEIRDEYFRHKVIQEVLNYQDKIKYTTFSWKNLVNKLRK